MSQMIDIRKVCVGPRYLTARVRVAEGAPLTTDQDLIGTTLVYNLMPEICDHVCLGDAGSTFKDAMPSTEIAHLLEHVTVELIARTGLAGSVSCGQTTHAHDCDERTFDIRLDCPDDVLVVAALSSAVWILQWAYTGGGEPEPGVDAIVEGIVAMVNGLPIPEPAPTAEPVAEAAPEPVEAPVEVPEPIVEPEPDVEEPELDDAPASEGEPVEPEEGPAEKDPEPEDASDEAVPEAEPMPDRVDPDPEPVPADPQPDFEPAPEEPASEAPATDDPDATVVVSRDPYDPYDPYPAADAPVDDADGSDDVTDAGKPADDGYNPHRLF